MKGMPPNYQPDPGTTPSQPQPDYSFIMNPDKPPRKPLFPGGRSVIGRLALVLIGLFIILIVFVVIRGFFSNNTNMEMFVSLAQKQQEIIHLTTNAAEQDDLPETTRNFVVTAQLSLSSTQKELLTYMDSNGSGINTKLLNQTVNAGLDEELAAAVSNSSYDRVFREILKEQLVDYQQALERTFDNTDGPNGQKILEDAFQESELLLKLLDGKST
jgi:hypothetical protein